jgi:hypothetical protein
MDNKKYDWLYWAIIIAAALAILLPSCAPQQTQPTQQCRKDLSSILMAEYPISAEVCGVGGHWKAEVYPLPADTTDFQFVSPVTTTAYEAYEKAKAFCTKAFE